MANNSAKIDFGDGKEPSQPFILFEKIIVDRGSRYSASIGQVTDKETIKIFLRELKSRKKYAKASHNTWAARLANAGVIYETKNDDGETGAGMTILRELQRANTVNCIVCVTRWFGGVKLQGDRFRHVQDATRFALKHLK